MKNKEEEIARMILYPTTHLQIIIISSILSYNKSNDKLSTCIPLDNDRYIFLT